MRHVKMLLLFLFPCCLFAQEAINSTSPFAEKLYLHTDRDAYLPGEDLWFKAYLLDARSNRLTSHSNNVYVELISPAAKVISRALVRAEEGLGKGDFRLKDGLPGGTYRIRAYTNWMRNFGDRFLFEKEFRVLAAGGDKNNTPATAGKSTRSDAAISTILAPASTIQFFPEGGSLVSGVVSLVAVKAEDATGRGIPTSGEVLDPSGQPADSFTCDSLGMGAFVLWPEKSGYLASVTLDGKKQLVKLPDVAEKGFGMRVRTVDEQVNVVLNCNAATLAGATGQSLTVTVKHTGNTFFQERSVLTETGTLFRVPMKDLPEGVACITAFDGTGNPLCERLIYISKPQSTTLNVSTDKVVYQAKENTKVTIGLNTTEKAWLSMSVTDADVEPVPQENIVSYLNLRSEIRGYIERPRRYFDSTNVDRAQQLDLLLLTQGWRGFIWKKADALPLPATYSAETGIDITGKVRKVNGKAPVPNLNITLFADKATGQKLFTATTDSAGRFSIPGVVFYGYQYLNFTSRSSTGMRSDGKSKGFSGGWIQVDSLSQDTLSIERQPERSRPNEPDELMNNQQRKFSFTGMNRLQEVTLTGKSYGFPKELFPITRAEQKDFGTLRHYLLYTIPGAFARLDTSGNSSIVCNSAPHTPIGVNSEALTLPMDRVLSVTLQKYVIIASPYNEDMGAVSYRVYLKLRPGALAIKNYFDNTVADMAGYQRARVFYAPKFASPDERSDQRGNTVHWEPDIVTDEKGQAGVSFNNKGIGGKVRVVVQGVTEKGQPLSGTVVYEVK